MGSLILRESPTNSSVGMVFGGGFARWAYVEIGPPTFKGALSTNENVYRYEWFPGAYIDVPYDP
jgi:hypothetical protein